MRAGHTTAWHHVLWISLFVFFCWILIPPKTPNTFIDFAAYWSAGRLLLEGGNPYDYSSLLKLQQLLGYDIHDPVIAWSPPWLIALLAPVSLVPFGLAKWLWLALLISALVMASDFCWQVYGGSTYYREVSWLASILFLPGLFALYFGQITPLMLLGIAGFLWCLRQQRETIAGVFLCMLLVKPHVVYLFWILLLVWALQSRRWKLLWTPAFVFLLLCFVALSLRRAVYRDYISAMQSSYGPLIWATKSIFTLMSFIGVSQRSWMALVFPNLVGVAVATVIWTRRPRPFQWKDYVNPILFISLLTTGYVWTQDWVVLMPAILQMLVWTEKMPARNWAWPVALLAVQGIFVFLERNANYPGADLFFPLSIAVIYVVARRMQASSIPAVHPDSSGERFP